MKTRLMLTSKTMQAVLLIVTTLLVGACVTPTYVTPEISISEISRASNEINRHQQRTPQQISLVNANRKVHQVYRTVSERGKSFCIAEGDKSRSDCLKGWSFSVEDDEDFNAYAHGENWITLNKGVLQVADDTELAFTIAHEIGHHALNHLNENRTNTITGAIVGGIIGVAIVEALGGCEYNCDPAADLIVSSAEIGSEVGTALYSREQESEADQFALKVIAQSGYQPIEARSIITHIGKISAGGARSSFGDSHPSGPERLANLDKMLAELRTPNLVPSTEVYIPDSNRSTGVESQSGSRTNARLDGLQDGSAWNFTVPKSQSGSRTNARLDGLQDGSAWNFTVPKSQSGSRTNARLDGLQDGSAWSFTVPKSQSGSRTNARLDGLQDGSAWNFTVPKSQSGSRTNARLDGLQDGSAWNFTDTKTLQPN